MDPLPARLAQASLSTVDGIWQRHVPAKYTDTALVGRVAVGRWGTEGGFPVLYLGVDVTVTGVDLTEDGQITAVCTRGKAKQRIAILDLPLPTPPPQGAEWIDAYRRWAKGA